MKITKAIYRIVDDVDVSIDLEAAIKNASPHEIAFVRSSLLFTDEKGRFLAADSSESEELIEENAKGRLVVGPWLSRHASRFQAAERVRATVTSTLCRKVRMRVGDAPVPADGAEVSIGESRELEGLRFLGLRCARFTEEREIYLELSGAVENLTATVIDGCVLRVALLDADESLINEAAGVEVLLPRLVQPLTASFYDVKKSQLKSATLRVWIEAYVAFATETAEAELELRHDDDFGDEDDEDDDADDTDGGDDRSKLN